MSRIPTFATLDPFDGMTPDDPGVARSLVAGSWIDCTQFLSNIPDPLTGGAFLKIPDTTDIDPFIKSLRTCPKSGMHNPQKNPQRYVELGRVCAKAAALLEAAAGPRASEARRLVAPLEWSCVAGRVEALLAELARERSATRDRL